MPQEALFDQMIDSILAFDSDRLMQLTQRALDEGVDPVKIMDGPITEGLKIVGDKFAAGEFFLMHMVAAAECTQKVVKELIEPELQNRKVERKNLGKIVIGTVAGDIHDIGKNIVATMLFASGFEVFDLGKDVPVEEFVSKAEELEPQIVGASALLSTTMPVQTEIVRAFDEAGLRDRVKLIFGGAPVTQEWVKEIGGDGYASNAPEAVRLCRRLLNINGQDHR